MPGQLKEIRNRITAVHNTQKITKAMKLVAASKLRRAQDRILQMRPYSEKLSDMLANIVAANDGAVAIELSKERPIERVLIVVLTSDRGLCGGFNTNSVRLARRLIVEKYSEHQKNGKLTLMNIGKKGYELMKKETQINFDTSGIDMLNQLSFENTAVLAESIMQQYQLGQYDIVEVVYNKFKNQITQIPTAEQFLPIKKIEAAKDATPVTKKADFIFEPDKGEIINELVPKILKTQFYRYLLDSNASEYGARMTAMQTATDNAEELLRVLRINFNRARQAAITTELTEIVAGAVALQG